MTSVLSKLIPKRGSTFYRKRVGRGGALGSTSGKGDKGQKARTGGRVRWGFEGGQTPLMRRLPKWGFSNVAFETAYDAINLDQLNRFDKEATPELLEKAGMLKHGRVKILGRGELKKALTVRAHKVSETAKAAIEKAGGKVDLIPEATPARVKIAAARKTNKEAKAALVAKRKAAKKQ
jgi:large subunit ribosomal protein L15